MLPVAERAASAAGRHPLTGKRIYIPPMAYGSARAFASAFRAIGLEAEPTPPPDHRTKELGAHYTSGDECYPAKVTVGDFMKVLQRPDIDQARIALFMPTAEGPCRFGQYAPYLRHVLDANAYRNVEILSPTSGNAYAGLGSLSKPFVRTGWRALLAADLLQKTLLIYRPYEERRGDAEALYEESLADLCGTLESTPTEPGVQLLALRGSMGGWRARLRRRAVGRAARLDGALPRPLPQAGAETRSGEPPRNRHRGRDFLPPEHVLEREPGALPGRVRRGGLAFRHRGVDLVHQLRALPQVEADRPHLEPGSVGRVGAQARAEARRARPAGAFRGGFQGPRGTRHLLNPGVRASLPAARRRLRRDGAQRRQGGVPGQEGRRRNHRHQPLHVHERHCLRSHLPAHQPRPGRHPHPQLLLRRYAIRPGPRLGRLHGTGAELPEEAATWGSPLGLRTRFPAGPAGRKAG